MLDLKKVNWRQDGFTRDYKTVYIYLKDHANKEGTCWPGIKTIAAGVSLSRSTVKRALDDLVRAGLLEKSSRWRENGSLTSNLYRIK